MTSPHPRAGASGIPSIPAPAPGSIVDGRYRLDGPLGEGAVGTVHRATHLRLHRTFALKLLKPAIALDPFSQARFRREAEALGQLRHPNIVAVTDSGTDPGTGAPYLVMELLEGFPLSKILEREGPLPFERALPILEAIAAALDAAHGQGILHRDLKPGNVLLCGPEVKVLDFGLAEIAGTASQNVIGRQGDRGEASLTATDDLLGTPLYIAPELIGNARAGRASDLYSFAVIAYELLAGRPPFQGSTAEVLAGHLEREPPRPEALPPEIWEALRPALAKDPDLRPATAGEVVRRLRAGAGRERIARWRRAEIPRRAFLAALLAAAVPLWSLFPLSDRWSYDLRMFSSPSRAPDPDPRILLLTLDSGPVPRADRADEVGGMLERVFAAGARGVAIDILLPDSWNRSEAFSNLVLRHQKSLTLAASSESGGKVSGTGCVAGLAAVALGPRKFASLFGFVNLDADADGAIRRGRIRFQNREMGESLSWAAHAAGTLAPLPAVSDERTFWIDHRTDPSKFERISWKDVPRTLTERPWIFRNRLVLVGGDLEEDLHRVPFPGFRNGPLPGLILQARIVDTLLAGMPVREPRKAPFLAIAVLWSGLAAIAALLARRLVPILGALLGGLLLYLVLSIPVFLKTGLLLPWISLVLPVLGTLALALILRRALPPIPRSPME